MFQRKTRKNIIQIGQKFLKKRISTITDSSSESFFNLVSLQPYISKIYLYEHPQEHPQEAKYQLLINERESTVLNSFGDSKVLLNTEIIWTTLIKK